MDWSEGRTQRPCTRYAGRPMRHEIILIIDDHALFRSGIASMLSTALDDVAILDRASMDDALATVAVVPTVVLLDIQLPNANGLDGMAELNRRWPAARIVIVSANDLPDTVEDALSRGAAAFLSKADRPDRMLTVLRGVLERQDPGAATSEPIRPSLTPRQLDVLELVGRGLSNKMIGRRLGLSEHTVRGHVQALLGALGVARRAEATFEARRLGLVR